MKEQLIGGTKKCHNEQKLGLFLNDRLKSGGAHSKGLFLNNLYFIIHNYVNYVSCEKLFYLILFVISDLFL